MGSDRSLAVDQETGGSYPLAAINREMVELKSLSSYFSRENNNFNFFHPCHWYKKVTGLDV